MVPDLIIKSNRRTLSVMIDKDGRVIVRAPKKLELNRIINFLDDKEKWIKNKKNRIESSKMKYNNFINEKQFMFLGKTYEFKALDGLKKIEVCNNIIFYPNKLNNDDAKFLLKKWYVVNAKEILSKRIDYFSNLMNIDYNSLMISNSKNRWGSCDVKNNIKLNYRLIMLPYKTIDYIIIHELCHIIEFNHSTNFYKIISSVMGDYKAQQNKLKELDFILRTFR